MRRFYKPLSVLLAFTMCVSLAVPALAEGLPETTPPAMEETIGNNDSVNTPEAIEPEVISNDDAQKTSEDAQPLVEEELPDSNTQADDCGIGKHNWEYVTTKEPTCEEWGKKEPFCTKCGKRQPGVAALLLSPLGHDWEFVSCAKKLDGALCTASHRDNMECARCHIQEERLNSAGHSHHFVITGDEVDLGSIGNYDTNTHHTVECTNCMAVEIRQHSFAPATCTEPETCACGKEKLNSEPLGHTFSTKWTTDDTNHWHVCSRSGCTVIQPDSKEAHTWDEGEVTKEPTTTAKGKITYTCTVCGKTRVEELPALNAVVLSYDANAGGDKVTGLPASQTAELGGQVFIRDYRNMKREGYKILGWSTDPKATFPDTDLRIGISYTLNKDTMFYAVWEKTPDEIEIPEGAKLQEVLLRLYFSVDEGGSLGNKVPAIRYDYSYEYAGKTYSGTTENEKLIFGMESNNQVLKVLVDKDGGTPTQVHLTLKGQTVDGYSWYCQGLYNTETKGYDFFWNQQASISVTSSLLSQVNIPTYHYYRQDKGAESGGEVTEREVDIVVAFVTANHESFTRDQVSEDYTVTYSYQDAEGKTVTRTLHRRDAEEMDTKRAILGEVDGVTTIVGWDEDHLCHHLKWTVTVPVVGEGIYLTMAQSNYEVMEAPYVWDHVFGTTGQAGSGNIGRLYVSKDNNPVTPYIYNVYAKEYTVTYTDGVENSEIFPDEVIKAKEGAATPTIADPTRSGYTFTGWSPAVADTVTGDVTYTAQWRSSGGGGRPTPTPDSDPEEPPVVDIPDPDVPLVDIPDEEPPLVDVPDLEVPLVDVPEVDPPLVDIPDVDVPLADVPKTGELSLLWHMTALVSAAGLAVLTALERRQRRRG